jgi:AcrR family transcriptional regulator
LTVTGGTTRGRERRQRLLDATAELVAVRGFHSVGIAEIGAAAGVTGSAIYRHFDNKQEMLVAVFDRVLDDLLRGARAAVDGAPGTGTGTGTGTGDALEELVRAQVAFALGNRAVISMYGQEEINLPSDDRRRLRRKQRALVQVWVDTLASIRPELPEPQLIAAVSAAIGLLNSVAAFEVLLSDDELGVLVGDMAVRALRADLPSPSRVPA